jgi:hypothetical protein
VGGVIGHKIYSTVNVVRFIMQSRIVCTPVSEDHLPLSRRSRFNPKGNGIIVCSKTQSKATLHRNIIIATIKLQTLAVFAEYEGWRTVRRAMAVVAAIVLIIAIKRIVARQTIVDAAQSCPGI